MIIENNKKEIKYLKKLGFKKDGFYDKSAYWFIKKIKHKYFKKCEVIVQDFRNRAIITVDCLDQVGTDYTNTLTIINKKYSKKNLKSIITFLTNNLK